MAATFKPQYEQARERFRKQTNQWPQMRKSADGREKASGLPVDLARIDAVLGDPAGGDVGALTAAWQSFEKHARLYAQQIDAKPGTEVLDWMTKQAAVAPEDAKKIVAASQAFGRDVEKLVVDVGAAVKARLSQATKGSEKAKVLEAVKKEVADWGKYLALDGVGAVMSPSNAELVLNPKTRAPAVDVLRAGELTKKYSLQLGGAIEKIHALKIGGPMPGATERSAKALAVLCRQARDAAIQLVQAHQMWMTEYTQVMKAVERESGAKHRNEPRVVQLMAKVNVAKQTFSKVDVKAGALDKAIQATLR